MYIIHISDTHLGKDGNLERWQQLTQAILSNNSISPAECILLHTGDLLETGNQENRDLALQLLNQLRPQFKKIMLAPGNHDYGGFWGLSSDAHIEFINGFHEYLFADQPDYFPVLQLIDDDYAFICLDSNQGELCFHKKLFAEGNLGVQQLVRLKKLMNSPKLQNRKVVVYLHHHPFAFKFHPKPGMSLLQRLQLKWLINPTRRFRRMKNAQVFLETISNKADILLFGHKHEGLDCTPHGLPYGINLTLDGGSSTDTTDIDQQLSYRLIDLKTLKTQHIKFPLR